MTVLPTLVVTSMASSLASGLASGLVVDFLIERFVVASLEMPFAIIEGSIIAASNVSSKSVSGLY